MHQLTVIALISSALACGSGAPCVKQTGAYSATYTQRSGDCRPGFDAVVNFKDGERQYHPSASCVGRAGETLDACAGATDVTCPNGWISGSTRWVEAVEWGPDGKSGSGVLGVTVSSDANNSCVGTYDVTYTRV